MKSKIDAKTRIYRTNSLKHLTQRERCKKKNMSVMGTSSFYRTIYWQLIHTSYSDHKIILKWPLRKKYYCYLKVFNPMPNYNIYSGG